MKKLQSKSIKAWAVLELGKLLPQKCHPKAEPEYWILPNKPTRKHYHIDYTFIPCTISYTIHNKKKK